MTLKVIGIATIR